MMSSQEHRVEAELYRAKAIETNTPDRRVYREWAQYHATMAIYEGMYELLGDNSRIDGALTAIIQR